MAAFLCIYTLLLYWLPMKQLFAVLLCSLCLTACVKDIEKTEYDTLSDLKGDWVQNVTTDGVRHYMTFTDTNMKLYYYKTKSEPVYLINSSFTIAGDSIKARDSATGKIKNYCFNMPYCTLLYFDNFKFGFVKDE